MRRERLQGAELERYLATVTRALVASFASGRVLLFGSFARADQNRASDLDLVVIADTGLPFCDRIGQALSACYAASTRLAVEALVYTPEEWRRMLESGSSFAQLVEREGRVLYDGESQSHRSAAVAPAGAA
ncbi:MAG: nucleotidyltransferase domain-containing protein [Deltaproteobacteria bacterium]|nr:MAG: nucleotidyltransferase domain-containing protein [Deltaproteobacteria bacterium]